MTSIAHSPLPWRTQQDEYEGEHWLWIETETEDSICGFSDPDEGIDDTDRANAAYIVQAVNAYPQLVAALRRLLIYIDHDQACDLAKNRFTGMCTCGFRDAFRTALTALEGTNNAD